MPLPPPLKETPFLTARFKPNVSGYHGYSDIAGHRASRLHPHSEQIKAQPLALLYNQPVHCDKECMFKQFLALEREHLDRPGQFEILADGEPLLRDCEWQVAELPFRTKRPAHHYQYAPSRKLLLRGRHYCLRDALSEPGYNRSLDGAEETQRFVVFSAMDPATPIGFFTFHRRIALQGNVLDLYLFPNFIYVAPPYRGLGYGIALVSAALEVWESELHHQASRYRERCVLDVRIDAETFGHPPARRIIELIEKNTRETLESCDSFWKCSTRRFSVAWEGP